MNRCWIIALALVFSLTLLPGCSREFVGGAAVGAGGAGAAYEYQNKRAIERLDQEFKDGKLTKEEYLRRKHEIEKKSLLY